MKNFIKHNPHSLAMLYYVFYLIVFFILEKISIPKFIIYCPLDSMIPFNEWFIIPYCLWFFYMPLSLICFMINDKEAYFKECFLMFGGMTICLLIYFIAPNGLNIRVDIPNRNILCQIVAFLQGFDPPTNVCPSIHVASTAAVHISILKSKFFKDKPGPVIGSFILFVLILLSTLFLKQHSIIDLVLGLALTFTLYFVTYYCQWETFFQKTPLKILWNDTL